MKRLSFSYLRLKIFLVYLTICAQSQLAGYSESSSISAIAFEDFSLKTRSCSSHGKFDVVRVPP